MEVIRVKKGELIARQRQRVKEWYILQEGVVMIKYDFVESKLGPNSIIGILEQDWFLCDYVAATDVTLFVFPCNGFSDLKQALAAEPKMRRIFLRTAMLQRHQQRQRLLQRQQKQQRMKQLLQKRQRKLTQMPRNRQVSYR